MLFTGCIIAKDSCFALSGLRPSTFSNKLGSESRKCGSDTAAGISKEENPEIN